MPADSEWMTCWGHDSLAVGELCLRCGMVKADPARVACARRSAPPGGDDAQGDQGRAPPVVGVARAGQVGEGEEEGAPAPVDVARGMRIPSGYEALAAVLEDAIDQAAAGKGRERHAREGQDFADQLIVLIGEWLGSNHFELGQAVKKTVESARLPQPRARAELLGGINYLAAAVIRLDAGKGGVEG